MERSSEESLNIYFVEKSPTDKTDKRMVLAFKTCKKADLKPEWIEADDAPDVPIRSNVVFVLRDFEGELFDYLASKECLVCGPRCLHTCVSMRLPVPENQSPVFMTPMRSLVLTSTKLPKQKKDEIKKMVGYMGGLYSDDLSMAVTHLVGNDTKSEKCQKAAELSIPIMMSTWIDAVWEAALIKDVTALDKVFDRHKLPVFKGMEISCSNLPVKVKKDLQKAIEANGGIYQTSLVQTSTYRLVLGMAEGEKFKHAQLWNIPCVDPSWIHESIARGVALSPNEFLVRDRPKCSTPTSELPSFMSNTDISVIPGADVTRSEINDTVSSVSSVFSGKQPVGGAAVQKARTQQPPGSDYKKYFDQLDLNEAFSADLFLDGCKIFLSGFKTQEVEKLKKILNSGGATIFMQLSDRVTHVVIGSFIAADAKAIAELQPRPHVVSLEWILESLKGKSPANVQPFLCLQGDVGAAPPPSPLSHKGLELLKSKPVSAQEETPQRPHSRKLFVKAQSNKSRIQELEPAPKPIEKEPDKTLETVKEPPKDPEPTPEEDVSMQSELDTLGGPPTFFQGLVFEVGVPEPEDTIRAIETAGGKVASESFHGVADYAIVAINETESHLSAPEIVTALWVEDCFEKNCIVKVEYYHQPLNFKQHCRPLEGTAICVSGFLGKERTFISFVAAMLGSNLQESFSRNNYPEKGIMKSTHLLCSEPSGSKYKAAVKWRIPVVNSRWILASALSGKLEPTEHYTLAANPTGSAELTPFRSRVDGVGSIAENTPLGQAAKGAPTGISVPPPPQFSSPGPPESAPGPPETAPSPPETAPSPPETAPSPPGSAPAPPESTPGPPESTPGSRRLNSLKRPSSAARSASPDSWMSPAQTHRSRSLESTEKLTIMKRKLTSSASRSSLSDGYDEDVFDFPDSSSKVKRRTLERNHESKTVTPSALRKFSIDSAGPSPFHMDTPDTPYGQVFCDGTPSPATRKKWKRYIDKFPDMYEGSPAPRDRRKSTPLAVIKKQLLVKFGGAEISGIEPGTGDLLSEGPFKEWAKTGISDITTQPVEGQESRQENVSKNSLNDKMGDTLDGMISGITVNLEKNPSESTPVNKSDTKNSKEGKENEVDEEEVAKLVANLRSQMPAYKRPSELPGSSNFNRSRANTEKPVEKTSYLQRDSILNREDFHHDYPGEDSVTWDHERPKFLEKVMERELRLKEAKQKALEAEKEVQNARDSTVSEDVFFSPKPTVERIFTLSNIHKNLRDKYESIIKSLGGEVSETKGYDEKSTHLVIEQLVRSEKLLCSMASGKWILHISYLDQCYEARSFLPEEDYEWGNPRGGSRLPELTGGSQEWLLARAAHRWRRRRSELGETASPFVGFRAVLLTPPAKTTQYANLLLAGGAHVLDKTRILEATHCFMNEGKTELTVSLSELAKRNIHCLLPVFLGEVLTRNSISPSEYWTDGYKRVHGGRTHQ